jgi:hypothetical protein
VLFFTHSHLHCFLHNLIFIVFHSRTNNGTSLRAQLYAPSFTALRLALVVRMPKPEEVKKGRKKKKKGDESRWETARFKFSFSIQNDNRCWSVYLRMEKLPEKRRNQVWMTKEKKRHFWWCSSYWRYWLIVCFDRFWFEQSLQNRSRNVDLFDSFGSGWYAENIAYEISKSGITINRDVAHRSSTHRSHILYFCYTFRWMAVNGVGLIWIVSVGPSALFLEQ